MNKTKIVCSIGPACESEEMIEKLCLAGMSVARFNMSHGTHASHKEYIDNIKAVRQKLGRAIALMVDTRGPEIRIKDFKDGKISLNIDDIFTLTTRDIIGDKTIVAVTYKDLPQKMEKGDKILLNDGIVELEVLSKTKTDIKCKVTSAGELSNHKSINVPGVETGIEYLSEQDKSDIAFAKEMDVDYLALSFVNCKQDVLDVKEYLKEIHFDSVKLISKIESAKGVENFDEIMMCSDGIMVARGDLGVEVEYVKLPILQKEFIKKLNENGKISIIATQMLESMINNKRPTRAEISDVANAIYEHATAIMLSGETASGKYPEEAVLAMRNIAEEVEKYVPASSIQFKTHNTSSSIGYAVYSLAQTENVSAINVVTKSGDTAKNVSRFKPNIPVVACTPSIKTFHQMSMLYGVIPVLCDNYRTMDEVMQSGIESTKSTLNLKKGAKVVQTGGMKAGISGSNLLRVEKIK